MVAFCLSPSGYRVGFVLEVTKFYDLVVETDKRLPLLPARYEGNANRAARIGFPRLAIPGVLQRCCLAQVLPPIVGSHAISMIEKMLRPFAGLHQPDDTVSPIQPIIDFDLRVALGCASASQGAAAASPSDTPVERSSFWIVYQQFTSTLRRKCRHCLPVFRYGFLGHYRTHRPAKRQTSKAVARGT